MRLLMVSVSAKAQSRFGVADVANARTINLVYKNTTDFLPTPALLISSITSITYIAKVVSLPYN
jgi:hypothetical protein